ncbi:hexose phosphate transporter [Mycoplasma sp. 'Moose RK']|uniref:hexose phosphate transporter n=1 Tax=Mycoplasma sp. 'Moose RK' TaxID=2780095 RepID=UPI0018C2C1C7|nr:hexose phosphate transporter [Mycoplasma sp. 'Moose RK']MBG0730911.1 MFS transporter [Mycoplasma sp. 'Moose RK']
MKTNLILDFAKKNINEKKPTFFTGFILWFLLVFAYVIFVVNWGFASAGLNGKAGVNGILGHFFDSSSAPSPLFSQAVNWGITIGRGIGSVLVGWLIVKVSHKYAVILSLIFMLFGIAAPYSPTYAGFVILRTIFAIGGTMQIVFIQPIVSNYMNQRQKAVISQFSPFFYPIGTIITLLPFSGILGEESLKIFVDNWQIVFLAIGLLTLIPLIGYLIFGTKFDLYSAAIAQKSKEPKPTLLGFLKQKDTWYWTILYGSWLVAVVFPFLFSKPIFDRLIGGANGIFNQKINTFLILFLCGIFVGPFSVGLISKFQLRRRGFINFVIVLGVFFYIFAAIIFVTKIGTDVANAKNYSDSWTWIFLIFGFLMGVCLWGIQGVILNLPHEYPNSNPQKIGFQFGLIWGLGYTAFTIGTILTSMVLSPPGVDLKSLSTAKVDGLALGAFIIIIILSLVSSVGLVFLREPNTQFKNLLKVRSLKEIKKIEK